jgi:hypothetical protein
MMPAAEATKRLRAVRARMKKQGDGFSQTEAADTAYAGKTAPPPAPGAKKKGASAVSLRAASMASEGADVVGHDGESGPEDRAPARKKPSRKP